MNEQSSKTLLKVWFFTVLTICSINVNSRSSEFAVDPARLIHVDEDLKPAVMEFLMAAKGSGVEIPIENYHVNFAYTEGIDPNYIGYCDYFNKTVFVSRTFWENPKNQSRQELIDHELGHCLLGRTHRHRTVQVFADQPAEPSSIMYPVVMDEKTYAGNKEYYRKELFNNQEFGQLGPELMAASSNGEVLESVCVPKSPARAK